MAKNDTRRIMVIKDLPSNIFDEAIFILKNDVPEPSLDIQSQKKHLTKELIIKEAQSIVNEYVCVNSQDKGKPGYKVKERSCFKVREDVRETKPKACISEEIKLRKRFYFNTTLNILLIAGIAVLVFLITRL